MEVNVTITYICGCGFRTNPILPNFVTLKEAESHVIDTGHTIVAQGTIKRIFPKE